MSWALWIVWLLLYEACASDRPRTPIPAPRGVSYCSSIRSIQKHVYNFDWSFPCDATRTFAQHIPISIEMTGPSSSFLDFPSYFKLGL